MHLPSIVTAFALSLPLLSSVAATGSSDVVKRGGHKQHMKRSDKLVKRDYTGIATFYNAETGNQGACGGFIKNTDWTVAIAGHLYGDYGQKSYWCGKQLVVTGNGKTTTVTVVDACPGCGGAAGLDMTPSLFSYFISQDAGVMDITWHLAGEGAPAPSPKPQPPAETPKPKPEPVWTPPPAPSSKWTPPPPVEKPWTPPAEEWKPSSSSWSEPAWTPEPPKPSPSTSSSRSSFSSTRSSSSSRSSSSTSSSALPSSTTIVNGTSFNSTIGNAALGNSTGLYNSTLLPNSTEVSLGGPGRNGSAATNITAGSIASGSDNKNADGTTGNLGRTAQIILDIAGLAYAAAEQ